MICAQTFARSSTTCGRDRVHLAVRQPRDRHAGPLLAGIPVAGGVASQCLQLDDLGRLIGVGTRVGVEALPALLAQPALSDEAAQDGRRGEALAVALPGLLHPLEHRVQPFGVGLHERRHQPAPRIQAGAGHHPEVDVAVGGDALLEHEAGLDERLQRQQLDELRHVRLGVARYVGLALGVVEAVAAGLRAELAFGDELLHARRHVEALVAVGLGEVLGDVQDRVQAEQVHEEVGAHRAPRPRRRRPRRSA